MTRRITLLLLVIVCFLIVSNQTDRNWPLTDRGLSDFVFDKTEIGNKEDPFARFNYHINLQVDPNTGRIPWGIYQEEKKYIAKLPRKRASGTNLRSSQAEWNPVGPSNVGGRTRAFAVDVTNEDILISGSVSGSVWRSENGGASWSITSDPNSLVGITTIAQDTREGRENIWYYGTGEIRGNSATSPGAPYRGDGVFKSIDGGLTWLQLSSTQVPIRNLFNSQFNYVYRIVLNHTREDADEIYLAAFGGILRSVDGGDSWEAVLGQKQFDLDNEADLNGTNSPFFTDLRISDSGVFYAYLSEEVSAGYNPSGRGVFRSVDGLTWDRITPNLPDSANRGVLAIAPTNEDVVYLFVDHGRRGNGVHSLWVYRHQGEIGTWTDLSENIPAFGGDLGDMDTQNSFNMVIEVHPNDEDIVFLGGTNLYRSLDGFRSTQAQEWIGGYDTANNFAQYPNHHADQHGLLFQRDSPFRLYSTHDGGISFTDASTIDFPIWTSLNSGYVTTQFYALDIQQDASTNFIAGGTQDNGSWLAASNALNPWSRLSGGDGSYSAIAEGARIIYSSSQNGRVFRSVIDFEEGELVSRTRVDPEGAGQTPGQEYLFVNPFILDPNNTDRMYVAGGDAIWRNLNLTQIPSGRSGEATEGWELMENTILQDSGRVSTLVASVDVVGRLYFGTSDGRLFRIDSAHRPSNQINNITSSEFPFRGYLVNVNINPENADELIVCFSNYTVRSIFHSTDGGQTFDFIGGNLEEFEDGGGSGPSIRWGTIVPMADGSTQYFVGTSSGLFSTNLLQGAQTEWVREGSSTIGQAIVTMMKYRPLDGRMAVATHGNGVFTENITGFKRIDPPVRVPSPLQVGSTYPNPFTDRVTVEYSIPEDDVVLARIFDLSGNTVKFVLFGTQFAGDNILTWDGTNNQGVPVKEGIYVLHILYQGKNRSRRIILNR